MSYSQTLIRLRFLKFKKNVNHIFFWYTSQSYYRGALWEGKMVSNSISWSQNFCWLRPLTYMQFEFFCLLVGYCHQSFTWYSYSSYLVISQLGDQFFQDKKNLRKHTFGRIMFFSRMTRNNIWATSKYFLQN